MRNDVRRKRQQDRKNPERRNPLQQRSTPSFHQVENLETTESAEHVILLRHVQNRVEELRAQGKTAILIPLHDDIGPAAMAAEAMRAIREYHAENPETGNKAVILTIPAPGMYGDSHWYQQFSELFEQLYYRPEN